MSIKDLTEEPWTKFTQAFSVGDVAEVKITKLAPFGAFARIMDEIEGLIHISELSYDKVDKVEDAVKINDVVKVKIIGINDEKKKISLSIKELADEPVKVVESNETVYEDDANNTIGDLFGDLFSQDKE
ncbi:MAG: S1 RNA-binding domain-containing protein [Eubacteriaceae bacterium]|nr:S1 RNA-binding domain-containing protein [Eubacteriaceae bacterium]